MTVARNVADASQHHVTLEVECIDRLYLNLYQPWLQTPGGAASFFRGIRGNPVPSPALMAPMTRDFVAAIDRFADESGLDLIRFRKAERKDDHTVRPPAPVARQGGRALHRQGAGEGARAAHPGLHRPRHGPSLHPLGPLFGHTQRLLLLRRR